MPSTALAVVNRWIDAFYAGRDDEMLAIAHPHIEVRPRVGTGPRMVRGVEELRAWLRDTHDHRSEIRTWELTELADERVLAEAVLDGMSVVAIFDVRDGLIARVAMYVSDRDLLEKIGELELPVSAQPD